MTQTVYGNNLTKFVPLNAWFRWWMLRSFLECGVSAKTICKRLGWRLGKLSRVLFASDYDLRIDDIAVWSCAIAGGLLDFKLIPNDRACGNNVDNRP